MLGSVAFARLSTSIQPFWTFVRVTHGIIRFQCFFCVKHFDFYTKWQLHVYFFCKILQNVNSLRISLVEHIVRRKNVCGYFSLAWLDAKIHVMPNHPAVPCTLDIFTCDNNKVRGVELAKHMALVQKREQTSKIKVMLP